MQLRSTSLHSGQAHVSLRRPQGCLRVRVAPEDAPASKPDEPAPQADQPIVDRAFPKRGLFSIADPSQEVYSKAGERFDPTKKGGRFKPEFIWQTNWQEQLKRQEDLERQQREYREQIKAGGIKGGTGPGVVSFSRLGSLNDLDVDLSEQLAQARLKKQAADAAAAAAAGSNGAAAAQQQQQPQPRGAAGSSGSRPQQQQQRQRGAASSSPSYQFKDLPTRVEARRFKRSARSAAPGTVASISAVGSMSPEEVAARAAAGAAAAARYEQLKVEFQAWAIGLGALGSAACYVLYGSGVATSYALGASAGLTYLRLLSRSVDGVGGRGLDGTIGQPRLLIPVVLALTYNRWNALYADEYGLALNFYGMLVGFFTYKLAVLGRQGLQLLSDLSEDPSSSSSSSTATWGTAGEGGEDDSAQNLDRIFISKVIRG